jgi:hypothetical protein
MHWQRGRDLDKTDMLREAKEFGPPCPSVYLSALTSHIRRHSLAELARVELSMRFLLWVSAAAEADVKRSPAAMETNSII